MKMEEFFRIQEEDPEKLSLERMARLFLVSGLQFELTVIEIYKEEACFKLTFICVCYIR